MLPTFVSYAIFLIIACSCGLYAAKKQGWEMALGVGMAASLLAATWFQIELIGLPFDVRSSVAVIFLIAFCVHSGRLIFSPITLLDCCVIAMVITHTASDVSHGASLLPTLAQAYGEWGIPYAAGRYAVMHRESLAKLSPWFVGAGVIVAALAIFESITNFNFWTDIFTDRDDLVSFTGEWKRYDIAYRAGGPTRHPIFLGVVLMLLIPWTMALIDTAKSGLQKYGFAALGLVVLLLGIAATISRGPLIGVLVAIVFALAVQFRTVRWGFIALLVVAAIIGTLQFERISAFVASTDGSERSGIVEVDGEAQIQSSSRNRLNLIRLYGPLAVDGGMLGYGTKATDSFPPTIPGIASNEKISIVDNSFILVGLRFGWIGCFVLVAMFLVSIVTMLNLRRLASTVLHPNGALLVTAFAAILVGVAIELLTVFWSFELAFWTIFTFGICAGSASLTKMQMRGY